MNTELYVITPIFNPFGFKSRYRLYHQFSQYMRDAGVKLFTIEAAFGDDPFVVTTPSNSMNMQIRTDQILWHKERMINLAYERIKRDIPSAQYFGWFDSDITFLNPNWLEDVKRKLSHTDIIQPFAEAINLSKTDEYMWNCPSTFRFFLEKRGFHQHPPIDNVYLFQGHPGLAWCGRKSALDQLGGLYENCIAGSGDTIMGNALKGDFSVSLPCVPSQGMNNSMKSWADKCKGLKIGFTRGALAHHWHGKSEERGYEKRWSILAFHNFDPLTDLVLDHSGLYKWAGNKPKLEEDIYMSLSSRNEDE